MLQLKLKIAELIETIERLSPRERLAIGAGVISALLFIVVVVAVSIGAYLDRGKRGLDNLREGVRTIQGMEENYRVAVQRRDAFSKKLERNDLNLRLVIGTIAEEMAIEIAKIDKEGNSLSGKSAYVEDAIKIQIRRIGFVDLYEFFHRIEGLSDLVYLKEINLRRRYDNTQETDATFTVATIKPKETT